MPEITPQLQLWAELEMHNILGETLKCSLPFILPKGEYHQPDLNKLCTGESEWLKNWFIESGLVKKGQSPVKLLEYSKDLTTCSAYLAPDLRLGSDQFRTYNLLVSTAFLLDDVIEDRHFFGKNNNASCAMPVGDIIRGKFNAITELPTTFPVVLPILKGIYHACELGNKANPNWVEPIVHESLARSYDDFLNGTALFQLEDVYPRNSISRINQTLYEYYRRFDCGVEPLLELAYVMYDILPTNTMRKDLLYQRLIEHSCSIVGHTNDLIGIQRDIRDGVGFSLVVHKARYMSLQEAFAEVAEVVRLAVSEFMLIQERILYLHGNDSKWAKIIRIIADYIDGHLFWCLYVKRYGNTKIRIVERKPVLELQSKEEQQNK